MDTLALKESAKSAASSLMKALPRKAEQELRLQYYRRRAIEPEILKLPEWCPPDKVALDIGANRGDYALALSRIARKVICFEPNPGLAVELERLLAGLPVEVRAMGVGDEEGDFELNIPYIDGKELHGWASVDLDFEGKTWNGREIQGVRKVTIPIKRLDSLDLGEVGFIKIDVEGHEFSALKGAEQLLRGEHPNLLVEIEQRHHEEPIERIFSWIEELGYEGAFLDGDELTGISEFDGAVHQGEPDSPSYRNNFFFTSRS